MSSRAKEKDAKAKAKLAAIVPELVRDAAKKQGQSQEDQEAAESAMAVQLDPNLS